jgi:hypothetical protein
MQSTKRVVWTWCPKCMVRTKHQSAQSAFLCLDCGCLHNGEAVIVNQQVLLEPPAVYEPARPAG